MQHWDDLKYLLALEESHSLIKAAKVLKTNPTTVSRHIKRLSEAYKKTLVTRQPSGEWALTQEGKVFAATAKRCNTEIDALNGDAQTPAPEIIITTTDFVGEHILAPHISNVISRPNDLVLTLDMRDRNVSLAFGEADLAIRLGRPTTGKLIASKLADIEMGVFSIDGKMTKRWIGLPSQYDWVPEMQFALDFFGCEPIIRLGSFASIRDIAVKHDLACVGPHLMMNGWRGLDFMDCPDPAANREVWSVFHETRSHDQALFRARQWAKDCFSSLPERAAA